ncbi:hypothetical protein PGTUg99_030877 [Puccinia graminis f. sp. tritici]|uniref:Secreted protein n=1 Tax=Puccinia graminis f. sp. tritici TaxID=56615 RepID=A0A5B0RET9_PUCGR|nr:hypothetical protein PGTUg99_030877 [Puccinia graminis f. sp. tritici]
MPRVCLQTSATIALIVVLIQLAEAVNYDPLRPNFRPAPPTRPSPPQHCGNGFLQNSRGDPTPLCTNYEDKKFECGIGNCHIYDAHGKQQPYSTLSFHHCQRIGENGEVEASDQTIQPIRFEADNKAKTLSRPSISVHPLIAHFRVLMDELPFLAARLLISGHGHRDRRAGRRLLQMLLEQ